MNGLSDLTVPLAINRERAEQLLRRTSDSASAEKIRGIVKLRTQRYGSFKRQVPRWQFRDICPMRAIEEYTQTGIYAPDDVFIALGAQPLSPGDRRRHLLHLIKQLETCPNYELGLVAENNLDVSIYQTFWLVKAGQVVLLECQSMGTEDLRGEIDLAIEEPRIIDAFYEYFFQLWNQLDRDNRDREQVIAWLHAQIAKIPHVSRSIPVAHARIDLPRDQADRLTPTIAK